MSDDKKSSKFENAEYQLKKFTGLAIRISIIILFSVGAWRFAWSDVNIDLNKFDFSDLLALLLALFAVAMSVAFYFKSTDSSNQFYDNIYNFTQKTSEILGRIEERFGEQLRHLDEGYGRMQSRFDGIPNSSNEIEKKVKESEGQEEQEKQRLEVANKQMKDMLDQLTKRARMEQKEKEEFYEKLGELAAEKDFAQARICEIEADRDHLKEQLIRREREIVADLDEFYAPLFLKIFKNPSFRNMALHDAPFEIVRERMSRMLNGNYSRDHLIRLKQDGILDDNNLLTKAGWVFLRNFMRQYRNKN